MFKNLQQWFQENKPNHIVQLIEHNLTTDQLQQMLNDDLIYK